VRASLWNTDAEIGGAWRVVLRRIVAGEPIVLAQPTRMDLWAAGLDPVLSPPTRAVEATLAGDGLSGTLALSVDDVTALGPGRFEHRVISTDETGHTVVLMRGVLTVRGRRDDL
jgi:hypothetical protein